MENNLEFFIRNFIENGSTALNKLNNNVSWKVKLNGTYFIRHNKTGKVYVGSTCNLYFRHRQHLSKLRLNKHWLSELQKTFNEDNNIELAFIVTEDREEAFQNEQWVLDNYLNSNLLFNRAKNSKKSGEGISYKRSAETIEKNRLASTGRKFSKESIEKMSLSHLGQSRKHRPDSIEKMRIAQTGKKASQETKRKQRELRLGKKIHSQETKDYLRSLRKGIKVSPETLAKIQINNLKQAKKVIVDGVVYESLAELARITGLTRCSLRGRFKSKNPKFKDWNYL